MANSKVWIRDVPTTLSASSHRTSPVAEISTIVGLISAATALVASVTGPLVTFHVGRTQVRAAVLSANRQRWIDGFRTLVAEFCSQIAATAQVRAKLVRDGRIQLSAEPESLHQFERLIFTFAKIRLMTDPSDEDHQQLVRVIEQLLTTLRTTPSFDDVQPAAEIAGRRIIEISHTILRREWHRVQRGI